MITFNSIEIVYLFLEVIRHDNFDICIEKN
jgi:hypothetical protein